MFGMGLGEILVVLFIALIFLGPEKIPSTARTLGKWFHEIKSSLDGVREAFEKRWSLDALEVAYIKEVLKASRGNKSRAALILGINRKTLLQKLKRAGR